LDDDEQRLWNTVVQEESRIDQSGLLYNDPAVTTYVNSVLAKLYPPDPARRLLSPEVKVLKNPLLTAKEVRDIIVSWAKKGWVKLGWWKGEERLHG
jgi:hypothetical protein